MILAVYFTLFSFFYRKKSLITAFIALFLALSAFSGYLVGNTVKIESIVDVLNIFYTISILHIFVSSFKYFNVKGVFINTNPRKIEVLFKILLFVSILSLVINSYVFYKILNADFEDFGAFKNSELGVEFRYTLPIPHAYISLASFLSPASFFMLAFAFYFLTKKRIKRALLSFLLSLNMPLQGFTMFSRSWTMTYFLLLIAFFILIWPTIEKRTRRKFNIILLLVSGSLIAYLTYVTNNRFSLNDYVLINKESLIKNGILYSIIDYYSQWLKNGIYVLSNFYSWDSIQFAQSSNTLLPEIANILKLYKPINFLEARSQIWPSPYYYTFNGLVTELVFDFGYFGTFIVAIIYKGIVYFFSPRKGMMNIYQLFNFGILVTIPLLSFTGNYLAVAFYNFAILYSIIIGLYLYIKINRIPQKKSIKIADN